MNEEPWNYGLAVDTDRPDDSVTRTTHRPGDRLFSPDGAPVELTVDGRRVPE